MMKTTKKMVTVAAAALALSFSLAQDADAAMVLTFSESGGDVILDASGSLDLTGLTESGKGASLGGTILLDTVNEQLQLGSGFDAPVNAYTLTVQNSVFSSTTNLFGTVDSWTSNTNSIRFQQNNGQVLVDDEIESGDTITVTSTHTFAGRSFSDFGLTQGDTIVWLENTNIASGDTGQVIVTAVIPAPLPSLSLEVNTGSGAIAILGDDTDSVDFNFYEITSEGNQLDDTSWNSLTDQDIEGSGAPDGSGDGWEESGGFVGSHVLAEHWLLGSQ